MVTTRFKDSAEPKRRAKQGEDPAHLAWLRTLPCAVTLTPNAGVAHHLLIKGLRGMGKKAPDWYAVPLRADIHAALHDAVPKLMSEEDWFLDHCTERADILAGLLWQCSGDHEAGEMLIQKWSQRRAPFTI